MTRHLARYCGIELPDSQCGYRLLDLHAWTRLRFAARHFEIESELIVRYVHAGYAIDFIPVQTRYGAEQSKIRPLRDTIRWFRWWHIIRTELARATAEPSRDAHSRPVAASIRPTAPAAHAPDAIA